MRINGKRTSINLLSQPLIPEKINEESEGSQTRRDRAAKAAARGAQAAPDTDPNCHQC